MSLGRKTLLIATLALAGLGALIYAALARLVSPGGQDDILVSYLAVSVIVAGGGFFLITLLLLNQLVLARLARLNEAIGSMSSSGDFSRRLEIDGRDELASLALEINNLLATLQQSQQKVEGTGESCGKRLQVVPRKEILAEMFRVVPVALAVCSVDSEQVREVNDRFLELVGLNRDQVIGKTFADLQMWADSATRETWVRLLTDKQPRREVECRLRLPGGDSRDTLASVVWLDFTSEPCFLFAACDITGRLNQEIQLCQARKMEAVGQVSAGFAHDFNNILAIVQGYTSILLADPGLDPQVNKVLKEVSGAADRAANLTRQLLLFSRKQIMQPKNLDLNRLLQGLEKTLQRLLGESSALKLHLSPDIPSIRADAAMLEQVIVNLAVNARESMPRGGQLSVSTAAADIDASYAQQKPESRIGHFTCLTVTDTGSGFEAAHLNHIFEPFFLAKGNNKGRGLGLPTVYGIVKQHDGWIEVTSEPAKGTTFKVFLPSDPKAASPVKTPPPGAPGGKERILLVEDEPGLCVMVEGILRRYGYDVTTAPNGVDAMQIWKQQKGNFDLLLTDMVMPEGLTGQQLAEKLKVQNPALKVIYSSGYTADLVNADGIQLSEGLNFLQKPYHPQKLAQTVRDCLDSTVEKRELAETTA